MDEDELCRLEQAGKQSDSFRAFSVIWILFTLIVLLSGIVLWLYYRQQLLYLKKRGLIKLFMVAFAVISGLITGPLDRAVPGRESNAHSCTLLNVSYLICIPFFVIAGVAQVLLFRNRYEFYKALGKDIVTGSEASSRQSYFRVFDSKLRRKQLYADERFVGFCMIFLAVLFFSIVLAANTTLCPELGNNDYCIFATFSEPVVAAILLPPVFVALWLSVYIHRKLKTFPDPFNLLSEIKTAYFYGLVFSLPGFALSFLNFGDPNGQEEVPFSYSVWIDAVFVWIFVYTVHYQIYKGLKFDEIQLLYREITLDTILKDKVGRELFKVHLTNEFSLENLYFIEAVEALRKGSNIEEDVRNIYKLFFEEDILNIKWETEKEIREKYRRGDISVDIYDRAFREVYQLTARDSFARFQMTPDFEAYIGLANNNVE